MSGYSVFRKGDASIPDIREEKKRSSRRAHRGPDPAGDALPAGGGAPSPKGEPEEVRWITLSVEGVANLLAGLAVRIEVGEPWDFASPDGENVLEGKIVEASREVPDDPRSERVVIAVTPFAGKGGRKIDHLTARRRYKEPTGIVERLAAGEWADVNLGYGDQVGEEDLPHGSSPFLIGGVRLRPTDEGEPVGDRS